MSEYNEKAKAYSIQYAKEKLKRIPLDVTKEKYDENCTAAASAGMSVNGFIKQAIDLRMEAGHD